MTPTPTSTPTVVDRYRAADAALSSLLTSLPPEAWDAPSPCAGWTARDVVGHLVDAQRTFLAGHGHDLGPAPDLADPAAAWRAHADRVIELVGDPTVADQPFDGHFGPTTVGDTLVRFYVFDVVAHRWDVAQAAPRDERFTDEELDALEAGIAGFGGALYAEGICEGGVEAPQGADRQARVLAALGRHA
jgi:uncharacterized protein (TIGR03086 family)